MCVHKNLFSCKVLTVQKYIKFCAIIASLYWWCFKYLSFCVYSYCDANIRYSNSYRRYNKDIPQFLRNKSPDFVKHCLLKIYLAENIDLSRIVNTGGGNFTVVSFSSNSKQRYELFFGDTCQNVLAMIGAELAISANIFLHFLKNTQPGRGKIFPKPFFKLRFRGHPYN